MTFFALQTIGRVPAMLNFTAGPANVIAACKAANVSVVLTSRVFVEKGHFESLVQAIEGVAHVIYLEDVRSTITFGDKLEGLAPRRPPQVNARLQCPGGDPVYVGIGRHCRKASCFHTAILSRTAPRA